MTSETHVVRLFVYDLSRGAASILSRPLLGSHLDGVWHTSVAVYGMEYLYGAHGISYTTELHSGIGIPDEVIALGVTEVPQELFHQYLDELGKSTFRGELYRLLRHNCNTFSNEVSQFLTGNEIPMKLLRFTEDIENSPIGQLLVPIIEAFSSQGTAIAQSSSNVSTIGQRYELATNGALRASASTQVTVSSSVQEASLMVIGT
uniref:DUF862 domain-containing protein n=1 Tax=Trichuris muris TaxID=70415 RepID=A0A5S6QSP0_TRIMR